MDDLIRSLMKEFVEEALPMTERLADSFLRLEREWSDGAAGGEILPQVRSDLHTIKGNSGMMGLVPIQTLAHRMEDVCNLVDGAGDGDLADLLIEGGDLLARMIRESSGGELPAEISASLLARLEGWIDGVRASKKAKTKRTVKRSASAKRKRPTAGDAVARRESGAARRRPAIPSAAEATPPAPTAAEATADTVRVDFRRLDQLLELVGEAMIARSQLVDAHDRLGAVAAGAEALDDLERTIDSLGKSLRGLQESLVETRLLPVSTVFRRYPRAVRDLAREFGKSVRLVTAGDDTTIDKAIIDRLGDPLLHLVRNAVAHGIESPAERRKAGKPEEAVVGLRAQQLCDRVVVSVSDDGHGLDESRIAARGRELGYDIDRLSPDEIQGLIFQPGFSTARGVSTLSGRGVGLDVVASTVEQLGGTISLQNEPGHGATFHLDLPLTLAVIKALFVEVDGERYALPLSYVEESFRLERSRVHAVDGRPVLSRRGELLALTDAGELLEGRGGGSRDYCVVVSTGPRRRGLLVDRLSGHSDVVVKGLEETFGAQQVVSGVTVLANGQVVFILDAGRITGGKFTGGAAPATGRA
jgi:two-component system chemotaxis sensor kinase CheA